MQGLTSHSHFDAASEKKFSFTLIQRDSQCFKQKSSYTASQKHTFKKRLLTSVTADANFEPSGKGVKSQCGIHFRLQIGFKHNHCASGTQSVVGLSS